MAGPLRHPAQAPAEPVYWLGDSRYVSEYVNSHKWMELSGRDKSGYLCLAARHGRPSHPLNITKHKVPSSRSSLGPGLK